MKILFAIFEVATIALPLFIALILLCRRSSSYDENFETSKLKFLGISRGQYKFLFRFVGVVCVFIAGFAMWQFYFSDNRSKIYSESEDFWNAVESDPKAGSFLKERGEQLLKKNNAEGAKELQQFKVPASPKSGKTAPLSPVGAMLFAAAIAIPARMGSTRFPGKPLAFLDGKTVIERVYESCKKSELAEKVVILTDSLEIQEYSKKINADCIMTSEKCKSGTERIIEALDEIDAEFVVNVQGDEPFISYKLIDEIISSHLDNRAELVTAASKITDAQTLINPNVVKVLRDIEGKSIYFSRTPLPYVRGQSQFDKWLEQADYWRHIGIYGYSAKAITKYSTLRPTVLEQAEMLEQLRFIAAGFKFDVVETQYASIGIDTPADLVAAEEYLKNLKA